MRRLKEEARYPSFSRQGGNGRSKASSNTAQRHSITAVPIWAAGKIVGEVRNGMFIKRARGSMHMLRKPLAWALDTQSLEDAAMVGATEVLIIDTETRTRYRASVALLRSDKAFEFNRGFGRQIGLPLRWWHVEDPSGPRQLPLEVAV